MTNQQAEELEIRRRGQELAVAWRKGRAAFVLDGLAAEPPLRAALIGSLVHETLTRWDPYDTRWANSFRYALLARSRGGVTPDELDELEREYRRQFGCSPPRPASRAAAGPGRTENAMGRQMERIRAALASGRPIVRERPADGRSMFLRLEPARR